MSKKPDNLEEILKNQTQKKTDGKTADDEEQSKTEEDEEEVKKIDVSNFFNYQKAINSLIDYLNLSIDDMIARNPRSDQLLFNHSNKKLILNSILESGYYTFCKYRLEELSKSDVVESQEAFLKTMKSLQGEMDLLAYLLVNSRLAHRSITFDLYLSLLKGGLFADIMELHEEIMDNMKKSEMKPNKKNITNIKTSSKLYI